MSDSDLKPGQTDYLHALLGMAWRHPGLWIAPLTVAVLVALLVGFLGPRQWGATQTFVVREELIGRIGGPGRFESPDSMKTVQETIGELARRPAVIGRTLDRIGPGERVAAADWPSEETVAELQEAIGLLAPGGAELGQTEVLALQVRASSRNRARQIVSALFEELQFELRTFRQQRASSMVREMQQAVELARDRYDVAARRLTALESSVGPDLVELRSLNEPAFGSGDLRQMYVQIEAEVRDARKRLDVYRELARHLQAIAGDPAQLVGTPRVLLESQPTLSRLKEKLVDARIRLANVGGNYSDRHPRHQAAWNAVRDIEHQVEAELHHAISGIQSQQVLIRQEMEMLQERAAAVRARLEQLAGMRVDYERIVDEVKQRQSDLATAWQELSQAESMERAAASVDFITRVDPAQAGLDPLGPSRVTLLLGGAIAGALIGLGLVMMATPTPPLTPPATAPQPPPEPSRPRQPRAADPWAGTSMTTVGVPGATFSIPDIRHRGMSQTR